MRAVIYLRAATLFVRMFTTMKAPGYCLVLALPKFPSYTSHIPDKLYLSRLGEFGEYSELSNEKRLYIKEHCRLLCAGNAVKVFSKFSK